jgi:hypothetical protein
MRTFWLTAVRVLGDVPKSYRYELPCVPFCGVRSRFAIGLPLAE